MTTFGARPYFFEKMVHILDNPHALLGHIMGVLDEKGRHERFFPRGVSGSKATSAVLFLLGSKSHARGFSHEPCLVFNKRSPRVRQAGDLCFPGGRISPRLDFTLSNLLGLPFFPLARWPYWSQWHSSRPRESRRLALLLATSLRESLEEMRLNPFGVKFLGPLPSQRLVMFDRVIYPMAAWITRQKRFLPNWEVEKIVYVPIRNLLDPGRYACYRLRFGMQRGAKQAGNQEDLPCFLYENQNRNEKEVLWGATYRMVTIFLDLVFGFSPPALNSLPVVHGFLDESYINGSR